MYHYIVLNLIENLGRSVDSSSSMGRVNDQEMVNVKTCCVFDMPKSRLACENEEKTIECSVISNIDSKTNRFRMFAIEKSMSARSFRLFPRNQDDTDWLNHTINTNGTQHTFSLFHHSNLVGLDIADTKCFDGLAKLLDSSTFNISLASNASIGSQQQNVTAVGLILFTF